MKFKIGQKVRIRPDLISTDSGGSYNVYVNHRMSVMRGQTVTIQGVQTYDTNIEYELVEDDYNYDWTEDLLLPFKLHAKRRQHA